MSPQRQGYALRLAYDGRAFSGFVRQPGQRTVEAVLRQALGSVDVALAQLPFAVAARTDAGVHALDQRVSFRVRRQLDLAALRMGLRAALPSDVRLRDVAAVDRAFHARQSARSRTYVYRFQRREPPSLGPAAGAPRFRCPLDTLELDWCAAADFLRAQLGTHDRQPFTYRPQGPKVTTLTRAEISCDLRASRPRVALIFAGDGFTRHLIRNWVAEALALARGRTLESGATQAGAERGVAGADVALGSPLQGFRGTPASAEGLTLWRVDCGEGPL